MTPDRFTLSIELGNEAMTSPIHVAGVLRLVANKLGQIGSIGTPASASGPIRDLNGNLVGTWRFQ